MKKTILMAFVLLSCFAFVSACPPSVPVSYTGNVYYNGELVSGNFDITAYLGGRGNSGVLSNGNYLVDVSSCYGTSPEKIYFWINDVKANEEPEYNGEEDWGKEINLNLTINELPSSGDLCGNSVKDAGEVCDGSDFGELTCSNYGFDSGNLRCSDSCNNIYTDACSSDDDDNDDNSPSGGSPRSSDTAITLNSNSDIPATQGEDEGDISLTSFEQEEEKEGFFPTITGAVIGTLGKTGTVLISAIIIALVVGLGFVVFKRRG